MTTTIPNTTSGKDDINAKRPKPKPALPLLHKAGDFFTQKFTPRDPLIWECGRGELAIFAAVTNRGKSTLLRNMALCLAAGQAYPPMVPSGVKSNGGALQFRQFTP